jgi:hypothetical protein
MEPLQIRIQVGPFSDRHPIGAACTLIATINLTHCPPLRQAREGHLAKR